jgi:hypothetical protein
MIKPKEKPCKGIGIAHGYGCGKLTTHRVNGLGKMCCYTDFLLNSENGKIKLAKSIIYAKKETKKSENAFKNTLKENIKTLSDYQKELQKEINTIVRLIDKGFQCISTGKPLNDKFDAGHLFSVGSNPTLRFNLLNIYAQSVYANQYLSGDQINFIKGIEENYGNGLKSIVMRLKSDYNTIKLSKEDLKEKIIIARSIVKHLKLENKIYNSVERIELRKKYNKMLGIYV